MINDLFPIDTRPREKLLAYGAEVLSDVELLAIFLNTGTREKSVLVLARELLERYSSLAALLHASNDELQLFNGIGNAKAVTLQAILELCRRYLWEQACEQPLTNTSLALKKYLQIRLKNKPRETFVCLLLSPQLRVTHYEELFHGTLTQVPVYPREIVKLALKYNAHAVVLGHNHPSGEASPSAADMSITHQIKLALATMDILLLDHIIIAQSDVYAFSEHGDL
jgi:DNA repair protein RadC